MSDVFKLDGSYSTTPTLGASFSGVPSLEAQIGEQLGLTKKSAQSITLSADAAQTVNLGGLTNVHVVVAKAIGGKVRLRLTSADGTLQAVPVDSFAVVISQTVPFTAIDLTRVAGVSTTVDLFLGERST